MGTFCYLKECILARKPADQSVNREDILRAAAAVFQRRGYDGATMKDIAAAVNLTAASLYHHFRNKDALLLAVLEAGLETIIVRVETIAASDLPISEKLTAMICEHITGVAENTAIGAAMVFEIRALQNVRPPSRSAGESEKEAYADFVRRREAFFQRRDHFEDLYRRVVREGIAAGTFRPVDAGIFTKTMLGAQNWVGVWYKPGGRLTGAEIAHQMADTFLAALTPARREESEQ